MRYQVIDARTQQVVGTYTNANRARGKCDRLDLEHGAIRYAVRPIEDDQTRQVLSQQADKADARRFTGAAVTGFGALA